MPALARNLNVKELEVAKILFADDDALLGDLVFHKLESCGHQVTVVDNGYSVLSAALRVFPDIVILDNLMPGLTGGDAQSEKGSQNSGDTGSGSHQPDRQERHDRCLSIGRSRLYGETVFSA